jgi:uncharacterized protein YeaO (DUF488 family)
MVYTSYFAIMKKLPPEIVPISICAKAPDWYTGKQYKKLAPKHGFFAEWKKNHDNQYYIEHFNREVLDLLDPKKVLKELNAIAEGKPFALVCYEKPEDFCHRHLVADWLTKNGIEAKEYTP